MMSFEGPVLTLIKNHAQPGFGVKESLSLPVRSQGFVCCEDNVLLMHHSRLFATARAVKHACLELTFADMSKTYQSDSRSPSQNLMLVTA